MVQNVGRYKKKMGHVAALYCSRNDNSSISVFKFGSSN